jgi:uncharacterized RDD family membrane protein YckC
MHLLKQVKSQTPESVELEFILAGVGSRTLALIVDYFIWSATLILFLTLWGFLLFQVSWLQSDPVRPWFMAIQLLIVFTVYIGYFIGFETLWRGQTPGKRYAKIRVIRADGRNVGLQQSILRALLRPIDDISFLGLLLIIFTPQEKRLGDLVAGTIVIQEGQNISSESLELLSTAAISLAPSLSQTAQIAALTPDEFATIRNYLYRYPNLTSAAKTQVSERLAQRLIQITKFQNRPPNLDPHVLIEAVYLAYQQQFRS